MERARQKSSKSSHLELGELCAVTSSNASKRASRFRNAQIPNAPVFVGAHNRCPTVGRPGMPHRAPTAFHGTRQSRPARAEAVREDQ
jgi:hypothetical protein